ncbi:hypothetical protein NHX12_009281 [Muraenolepis orangiensis]|uniref:Galactose-3-O-sulfotransferase 2 n=1 Tax=Muraenolepis orangiensis TaxID=630683 RepID=A0A9Q0DQI0_9TELE|nr:hypothetical protein NHX12_009281 [Muraenolepis orangiensis]
MPSRNDTRTVGFLTSGDSETPTPTEEQPVESSFGLLQRLQKLGKSMFLNTQTEADEQHVTPGEEPKSHLVSQAPDGVCKPQNHIVFLKTHKTASSTMVNILYRYGDARNLTFGLPLQRNSQFYYPGWFSSSYVQGFVSKAVKEFHIICNHMRFNKPELEKVMPNDTFYFSIMRHPVTMLESAFTYYKSIHAFHASNSLEDFLDSGLRNENPSVASSSYAHNNMAFDFGFNNNVSHISADLEERVAAAVAAIERDFDLILITEYFDESVVMLKHMLCWSLDDVVSFKLNSRSESHRPLPHIEDKIALWNTLDWRLYAHFNTTFWQRVNSVVGGEEMVREVERLRRLRERLQEECLQGGLVNPGDVKDRKMKPYQNGAAPIQGYNVKPDLEGQTKIECEQLITPELQYSNKLYTKQFGN